MDFAGKFSSLLFSRSTAALATILVLSLAGCAPATFIETMNPNWASIEIRKDLEYNSAWEKVVDSLTRRFDLEVVTKESGYIRTGWLYTWTGKLDSAYKVRVTVKFSQNRRKVDIKSEAIYKSYMGTDTLLVRTMKTDIMGVVSRTTK